MRTAQKRILWVLFGIYCGALFLILFMRKGNDISLPYWEQVKMNTNLVPFRTIYQSVYAIVHATNKYSFLYAIINVLGNLVLFIPYGFCIPRLFERYRVFGKFVLLSFVILLSVETLQVLTLRGCFDIDDIILNLVGAVLAYLISLKTKSRLYMD